MILTVNLIPMQIIMKHGIRYAKIELWIQKVHRDLEEWILRGNFSIPNYIHSIN